MRDTGPFRESPTGSGEGLCDRFGTAKSEQRHGANELANDVCVAPHGRGWRDGRRFGLGLARDVVRQWELHAEIGADLGAGTGEAEQR